MKLFVVNKVVVASNIKDKMTEKHSIYQITVMDDHMAYNNLPSDTVVGKLGEYNIRKDDRVTDAEKREITKENHWSYVAKRVFWYRGHWIFTVIYGAVILWLFIDGLVKHAAANEMPFTLMYVVIVVYCAVFAIYGRWIHKRLRSIGV
jgi:hypothetical protein